MSGYLQRLVERVQGRAEVLRPLVPSRFDPGPDPSAGPPASLIERHEEVVAPPPLRRAAHPPTGTDNPPPDSTPPRPAAAADAPEPALRPIAPSPAQDRGARAEAPDPGGEPAPVHGDREAAALEERVRRAVAAALEGREPPERETSSSPPVREWAREERVIEREVQRGELRPGDAVARQGSSPPARLLAPAPPPLPQRREPAAPPLAPAAGEPGPIVHVTIGRVEVRAVAPAVSPPAPARRTEPAVSLQDYLRRLDRGTR